MASTDKSLRIAALVKQVPWTEELRLGADGRLVRDGTILELSAYCRRAVSQAVALAAAAPGSSVTVLTLGPPSAEAVLREALAWGLDRGVAVRGVLLTDPAFAGSDTIATARALAAALELEGPFDLILTGRNSLDADTGQVPPQLAELLGLPFASGVRQLEVAGDVLLLGCEHDDSWVDLEVGLPAVLSCAERLCAPAKVPPPGRAKVPALLLRTLRAVDVGPGPWGAAGSLTTVGTCREVAVDRLRQVTVDASVTVQVKEAVRVLVERGALTSGGSRPAPPLAATGGPGGVVAVIADPDHDLLTRELCGLAARLAGEIGGSTVLLAPPGLTATKAGSWGADRLVRLTGTQAEEDVAGAVASWAAAAPPWAVLAGSTTFGREVAARVAARLGAGLTGDATEVEVTDGRLVAWKPAFGGQLVAAVTATSPVQMVTVRAGVLPRPAVREHVAELSTLPVEPAGRVRAHTRRREGSLESLAEADVVIGVGNGVEPDELGHFDELQRLLGAEVACTRKLTDAGWMPHARQIGITGRSISPRLYLAVGTSGGFNHMAGVLGARTVLAINPDPEAMVWQHADVGVVASFQECVPLLVAEVRQALRAL